MKLLKMEKVRNGTYLKNYELTYLNKAGKEKKYEIVSRKDLKDETELGRKTSGVSIAAFRLDQGEKKLLLLKEFRMGVNQYVYNLCAGMTEGKEALEDCIRRELYEETGLKAKNILEILPPSYAAVAISDTKTHIAFVEVEGEIEDHSSENEMIQADFYTRAQVAALLETEEFSSRAQMIAYFFTKNPLT